METHEDIAELVSAFEACTLPKARWTHRAHLTVALWYLWHHPRPEATRLMREGIQRYNLSQGNLTGYHETMTLAWMAVISRFLEGRQAGSNLVDWVGLLIEHYGNKGHLLRYYTRQVLLSDAARHAWVPPDRHPID